LAVLSDLGDLTGIRNLTATGTVILSGNTFPTTSGSSGQVLTTNGSGTLSWTTNGAGDVTGPASATDNAVARFDGTTGKLIQSSIASLSDLGDLTGLRDLTASGTPTLGNNTYPTTTGSANQVMVTNGSGALSFATLASSSLSNTGVTAASYKLTNLTVDAAGRITTASSGGPASSTSTGLAYWNGTSGNALLSSTATVSSTGVMSGVVSINSLSATNNATTLGVIIGSDSGTIASGAQMIALAGTSSCSVAANNSYVFMGGAFVSTTTKSSSGNAIATAIVGVQNSTISTTSTGGVASSGIFGSRNCEISNTTASQIDGNVVIASRYTKVADQSFTLTGGYNTSGSALTTNRKWDINSQTGQFRSAMIAGSYGSAGAAFQTDTVFDFAEYMENLTKGVIPYGTLLTAVEDKVKPAEPGDYIVGICSSTPAFLANDSPYHWAGRWLKDEWGRAVTHEIPSPFWEPAKGQTEADRPLIVDNVENPLFDSKRSYKSRAERPDEYTVVGMAGQILVRVDETVTNGCWVEGSAEIPGLGTKTNFRTQIRALRVTTPYNAEKGYGIAKCRYHG
jgi:hypothetical protein